VNESEQQVSERAS